MKALLALVLVLIVAVAFAATRSGHESIGAAPGEAALVTAPGLPEADFVDLSFVFPTVDEGTKLPVGSSVSR